MTRRFRPYDFSHSRSHSAPTIPSFRLTPPTPHGSFHETDYDSDDSIPTSAAAMPRPNRYTKHNNYPYAYTSQTSTSPAFPPPRSKAVDPQHIRETTTSDGQRLQPKNVWMSQDGMFYYVQLKKVPYQYPSEEARNRLSQSQSPSHFIFQTPMTSLDPALTGTGLHQALGGTTTGATEVIPEQTSVVNAEDDYAAMTEGQFSAESVENVFVDYTAQLHAQSQPQPQNAMVWPVDHNASQ
ncbi:hypothetical protein N0V90_008946 [Kalmusia sp. IMI 367209]|nr:hypothetical protein N0V90_008946 [Kalmusia sp. IMI 367209]